MEVSALSRQRLAGAFHRANHAELPVLRAKQPIKSAGERVALTPLGVPRDEPFALKALQGAINLLLSGEDAGENRILDMREVPQYVCSTTSHPLSFPSRHESFTLPTCGGCEITAMSRAAARGFCPAR